MSGIKQLGEALMTAFRTMRQQAKGGKERFGDHVPRLAAKVRPIVRDLYRAACRRLKMKYDDHMEALADQRTLLMADSICDTTGMWVQELRDEDSVFGADRAASAAMNEASFAHNQVQAVSAGRNGRKLVWRNGPKPCKECKKYAGRIRKPGSMFGKTKDGRAIYHPPDPHPNCTCRIEEVQGRLRRE